MSIEGSQPVKLLGAVAGADLSASTVPYKFVKWSTTNTGRVVLCAATTDVPCGVIQGAAPTSALDQPVEVVALGQTKLQSAGSMQTGNACATTASGQCQPAVSTQISVGTAGADAAGVGAGGLFSAFINCITQAIKA